MIPDPCTHPVPKSGAIIPAPMTTETAPAPTAPKPVSPVLAPANRDEYNRTDLDFRLPMPRPKVRGITIDFHCHLFAARHAKDWFEAADHYGLDCFLTMSPLEEAAGILRDHPDRVRFIAVPKWQEYGPGWIDDWLLRIESFYNLGSRILKIHVSPGTLQARKLPLDSPKLEPVFRAAIDRKMAIMTHVGDPDTWYGKQY